jgi:hypothetical protein
VTLVRRRDELLRRLCDGGPEHHRTSTERFQYRLDTLLDLHDVETALEELRQTVWYMATCAHCSTPPTQFEKDHLRQTWLTDHVGATGHIVIKFEEPR